MEIVVLNVIYYLREDISNVNDRLEAYFEIRMCYYCVRQNW